MLNRMKLVKSTAKSCAIKNPFFLTSTQDSQWSALKSISSLSAYTRSSAANWHRREYLRKTKESRISTDFSYDFQDFLFKGRCSLFQISCIGNQLTRIIPFFRRRLASPAPWLRDFEVLKVEDLSDKWRRRRQPRPWSRWSSNSCLGFRRPHPCRRSSCSTSRLILFFRSYQRKRCF